jgi:hypothetical protein
VTVKFEHIGGRVCVRNKREEERVREKERGWERVRLERLRERKIKADSNT